MNEVKFSEDLKEKAQNKLIHRIINAIENDSDIAEGIIRYGFKAIEDLDGIDLMDEYMNWHGTYSLEENPDDILLERMLREVDSFNFEKEVLNADKEKD
jgi:hypothetical protein